MPITEGGKFSPVNTIVSPGVFTRENDLSGVAQGVADIGAAIVAPFSKGPGFSPTLITNISDLEEKFGVADGVYYGPYTAKEYLNEKGFVTVCRVGALTGYHQKNPYVIWAEPGTWTRSGSAGALNSGSSFVNFDANSISDTFTYVAAGVGGSLTILGGTTLIGKLQSSAVDNTTLNPNSTNGSLNNSGQTYTFTLTNDATTTSVYVTSSIQGSGASGDNKLIQAINESTTVTSNFSASLGLSLSITNADNNLPGTDLKLISGSLKAIRSSNGCGTQIILSGVISGSFGNIGTFTTSFTEPTDPCNPGILPRKPLVLAVLANTQYGTLDSNYAVAGFSGSSLSIANSTAPLDSLTLTLKQNDSLVGYYDFSLNPNNTNYISNVFGFDATAGDPNKQVAGTKIEAAYLYNLFEDSIQRVSDNLYTEGWNIRGGVLPSGSFAVGELLKLTDAYSTNPNAGDSQYALTNASTPWILSQGMAPWGAVAGTGVKNKFKLFKVHTLSDGTSTNKQYKVEISNVKLSGTVPGSNWGSFTLSVRKYSDTDSKPQYLEIFQNLTLDPDSSNFIARRIGDRYNYITYAGKIIEFGTYNNLSKYIRIEVSDVLYPETAVPYGFEPYISPLGGTIGNYLPEMKYSKGSVYGLAPGKYASGTVFGTVPLGADAELTSLYPTSSANAGVQFDVEEYFAPTPFGATIGQNVAFDLESTSSYVGTGSLLASTSGSIPSTYDAANESTYVKMRKFVVGFQGGFDGQSPAIPINVGSSIIPGNTQGLNCTNINSPGSVAYKQCVGAFGNADEFDINMIVTPGIFHQHHSYVTQLVIDTCEARGDCFYIMDNIVFPSTNQSVGLIDSAVNDVSTIDTSYAATYYPWIKILDTNLNKIVSVPPSVVMPSIYAANDNASAEWFAPAGLNRGGIPQAVQVLDRTTHSERDTLYEGRVNPIAAFPGQGICVWGQKTLQLNPSALDRVNVRRLLIALKKFIASTSKFLVFEQNVAATRNRFLSVVNPYLESVQQRNGVYAFQVKMDEQNNTPDLIDRNILYGQIYIQPTRTSEFIILDFNILPTGAQFSA